MRFRTSLIAMIFALSLFAWPNLAKAQTAEFGTFRQNFATVIFAGLGGAVLGLSTLSFYGEPQEHIGNIWTGLALGVIGGTTYVVQKATDVRNSPSVMTDPVLPPANPNQVNRKTPTLFAYQFSF